MYTEDLERGSLGCINKKQNDRKKIRYRSHQDEIKGFWTPMVVNSELFLQNSNSTLVLKIPLKETLENLTQDSSKWKQEILCEKIVKMIGGVYTTKRIKSKGEIIFKAFF